MLYAPIYCSYGSVRRFEKELEQMMREVPRAGSPATTMIVGFDSHFLGYRHAGYYLPAYTTVQFPAVQLAAGKRVFTMRGRDTKLEPGLPEPAAQRFVFFPLPGDDAEYGRYAVSIRKRFAAGRLRSEVHGGVELITGQSVDLGGLFRFPVAGK